MAKQALYTGIAARYRLKIETGELAPGDRLPTAAQMAEDESVSRMTAHKAVVKLQDDGYVYSTPRGTVVNPQVAYRLYTQLRNILNEMERGGQDLQLVEGGGYAVVGRDGCVKWMGDTETWEVADTG